MATPPARHSHKLSSTVESDAKKGGPMSDIGGSRQSPNPAGELAKSVLGPLFCASGLLMALVGIIDEDISLEFMGALMGLGGYLLGWRVLGIATMIPPRCC
jgi:hypothetical protein